MKKIGVLLILVLFSFACSSGGVSQSPITGSAVINVETQSTTETTQEPVDISTLDPDNKCDLLKIRNKEYNELVDSLNEKKSDMLTKLNALETSTDEAQKATLNAAIDTLVDEMNILKPQIQLTLKQVDSLVNACK
tara:strand:- start:3682 stop:4089 length:408 start_codon:yes stop_codon:yes gene_type:complete